MPILSGQQFGQLRNIVAQMFTRRDLTQFVKFELGIELSEIVNDAQPKLDLAFDLIEWLELRERTMDFLRALWKKSATPQVVEFCRQFPEFAPPNEPGENHSPGRTPSTLTEDEELERALLALSRKELAWLVTQLGESPEDIAAAAREPLSGAVLIRWARQRKRLPALLAALAARST
jgi:Effector-associated domain 1